MSKKGGSTSSSAATTTQDKKQAIESGVGVSGDYSDVAAAGGVLVRGSNGNEINLLDGGAIEKALAAVESSQAKVIDFAGNVMSGGASLLMAKQQEAADTAAAKPGSIDNRTIAIVAVAAFAAYAFKGK